jgi:hypothetical protein
MRNDSFETTVEIGDDEVEVTVEYGYSPGTPGKTYGPPENCYPAEGPDVDVVTVYRTDDKTKTDIMPLLSPEVIERLSEGACENGEESEQDRYEEAMERKGEEAREREWDR